MLEQHFSAVMLSNKFLLLACLSAAFFTTGGAEEMENFVRLKMANYSTWLKGKNLDPAYLPDPFWFPLSHEVIPWTEVFISNQKVSGHSGGIITTRYVNSFIGETSGRSEIGFDVYGNITFSGQYGVSGKIMSNIPLTASGEWYINVPHFSTHYFYCWFEVAPSGNIIPEDNCYMDYITPDLEGRRTYFETFLDDKEMTGCQNEVKEAVDRGFNIYIANLDRDSGAKHPIRAQFLQYWKPILSETTYEEIISTPPQPPGTIWASTSSTRPTDQRKILELNMTEYKN